MRTVALSTALALGSVGLVMGQARAAELDEASDGRSDHNGGIARSQAPDARAESEALFRQGLERFEADEFAEAAKLWTESASLLPDVPENGPIRVSILWNLSSAQESAFEATGDAAHLRAARATMDRYQALLEPVFGADPGTLEVKQREAGERIAALDLALVQEPPEDVASVPDDSQPTVEATPAPEQSGPFAKKENGLSYPQLAEARKKRRVTGIALASSGGALAIIGGAVAGFSFANGAVCTTTCVVTIDKRGWALGVGATGGVGSIALGAVGGLMIANSLAPVDPGSPTAAADSQAVQATRAKLRIAGFSLIGVGGAALVAGAALGGLAAANWAKIPDTNATPQDAEIGNDVARLANAGLAVGLIGPAFIAVGATLVTAKASSGATTRVTSAPMMVRGGAGLSFAGAF